MTKKRKRNPEAVHKSSIIKYIKQHDSFSTFRSNELLEILNCETPETAKLEFESQLNRMLTVPRLNEHVKSFVSTLLVKKSDILSNDSAKNYWLNKKNATDLQTNAQQQVSLYNQALSQALRTAESSNQTQAASGSNSLCDEIIESSTSDISTILHEYWKNLLLEAKLDPSLHKYSGLKNNIIIIGDGIKRNEKINEQIYNELNERLNITQVKRFSIHPDINQYYMNILNAENIDGLELAVRQLPSINFEDKHLKKECFLLQEVSLSVVSFIKNATICETEEKSYRAYFVHALCTAINDFTEFKTIFLPAEAPLKAMNKHLKDKNIIQNDRETYKADGIFLYESIEFCINEISGPFNYTNRSKYQFDFHKALYGCMSVMWYVVQKFNFASLETLEELNIFFLHCKVNTIQLWSLKYDCDKFVMHREKKITISNNINNKSKTIHDVMYLSHTCRIKFEQTIAIIHKLKKEHKDFENLLLTGQADITNRVDLRNTVEIAIYKLTETNDSAGLFDTDPISIGEFDEDTLAFLRAL